MSIDIQHIHKQFGNFTALNDINLTIESVQFIDNENGILTSNAEDAELRIEASEFANAPRVVGGLHHLLYLGRIGKVTITANQITPGKGATVGIYSEYGSCPAVKIN